MTKNAAKKLSTAISGLNPKIREAVLSAVVPRKIEPGTPVYARGTTSGAGSATGKTRMCRLEGCGGTRIEVLWTDGKKTWPCLAGTRPFRKGYRIL